MARLDVYHNGAEGYLLDVQTNILFGYNTRIVVPLMPPAIAPYPGRRLNPTFLIEGRPYVMVTQYLGSAPVAELGRVITNLDDHHDTVVAALDMIFLGF